MDGRNGVVVINSRFFQRQRGGATSGPIDVNYELVDWCMVVNGV